LYSAALTFAQFDKLCEQAQTYTSPLNGKKARKAFPADLVFDVARRLCSFIRIEPVIVHTDRAAYCTGDQRP
jgi:hypothetical protein